MDNHVHRAMAIVGVGAVLPDAPNVAAFWQNIKGGRYCISEVPPGRWDTNLYFDADPAAPDKTYSKIGGWVRDFVWDPLKWKLPIPPRVAAAMDDAQRWAIACVREALEDYGYPKRSFDPERTAVILGNAMGGEKQYLTVLRVFFPEYASELEGITSFAALPEKLRRAILDELHARMNRKLPEVTEDTMPGELSNCIAGRIANLFNLHGPNFTADAACASSMAALSAAVDGLAEHEFDLAITGGVDHNMSVSTFVKFCKIGALSPTGSRPYAEGADGFVMGEGAAIFILKRLADAERDGDKIYAVLRGIAGSSDGKGKGITAPNPVGPKLAMRRAWEDAGLSPATATLIEGHGTSTRVGDLVELQCILDVFNLSLPPHSVALGSVKSNIGHLKSAAGAAGVLKAALAVHEKVLPPTVNCAHPHPDFDFAHSPIYPNTELKPWDVSTDGVRRAGASAFGFGGTNFHVVLEEHIPGKLSSNGKRSIAVGALSQAATEGGTMNATSFSPSSVSACTNKAPLRGALLVGAESAAALAERLRAVQQDAASGGVPAPVAPAASDLRAPERLAIDYTDAADLADKSAKALKALAANQPAIWKALRAQGIFRGHGAAPKVAFLYTGQGSQYVNMMRTLRDTEPIVAQIFAEADRVMTPLLGKPLSEFIFINGSDPAAVARAEDDLRQTAITQPAVLATDASLTGLLAEYGICPDMAMGHSLGEYGALVAAGAIPFDDALEAVSARGREMTRVSFADNGRMAAVFAPLAEIERILKTINGYVVIANINSEHQSVIGGASKAVEQAMEICQNAGYEVAALPVSHAFHTSIVAPASVPLKETLRRLRLQAPGIPVVANVSGDFYPMGPDVVPEMLDILARQVASPVQFIKGLRTLYDAGARVFVETGPKKALQGFVEDVLGSHDDVLSLFTNHPKIGDIASFNQALCGLYAAGLGAPHAEAALEASAKPELSTSPITETPQPAPLAATPALAGRTAAPALTEDRYLALGRVFADALERGYGIYHGQQPAPREPVVITGAALGLPGTERIFDDGNIARILRGEQFIDTVPTRFRRAMLDKHITRLVKSDNGGTFETITNVADVIKLAGRGGAFDLENEFGVSSDRMPALDRVTRLAIAAGIDALRDAGIPLVLRYKTTSKGTQLPDRWSLPDALRDDTGVIFGSAFPGCDSFADEMSRYYQDFARREHLTMLESLLARTAGANGHSFLSQDIQRRIEELRAALNQEPYVFDRRFLFRVLAMGHSQFAEFIGARGPNTQINAACASTTQAVALAEDWIHTGRCRRVIVLSADDITSDHLLEWFGPGFLASGAAATDEVVEEAAIPFDRRRHGMIIGMGAAALVVESAEAARERGIRPICEVLSSVTANSAFHGTRLDVQHIANVMENLVGQAEASSGIKRDQIASRTMFMSHETYTPARGGSAAAEIHALRRVFGSLADAIVIANTKGFTGHAMAAGIEDVVAIKALETGCVPPVANFKEIDPELGALNLSKGGSYPVEYALRLGAGFGSQISMTLLRWVPGKDGRRPAADALGYAYRIDDSNAWTGWLKSISAGPVAELEVVHRTLRIRDYGVPARVPAPAKAVSAVAAPPAVKPEVAPAAAAVAQVQMPRSPVAQAVPKPVPTSVAEPAPKPAPIAVAKVATAASIVAPPPPAASAAAIASDPVKDRILTVVAAKTGYPVDMLDLDLDLEADLGVDTVKQAEVFAAIREAYGIARDDSIKLRDFPTLGHVINFVYQRRPDLRGQEPAPAVAAKQEVIAPKQEVTAALPPTSVPPAKVAADAVKQRIIALVVEKTGYPADMLDLDLDLEADLGIDTVKQAELFAAIREAYGIARDDTIKLRDFPTLGHVINFVYQRRPDLRGQEEPAVATKQEAIAPEQQATAATPPPVVVPAKDAADAVKERIIALVVEKTGYPAEMLDLDLDLEADLGVDTVKQAELFAGIRETYNIPRDPNLKLRDFPTLAHVIRFVYDRRPDLAAAPTSPKASEASALKTAEPLTPLNGAVAEEPASTDDAIKEKVLGIVAEKTGYPQDMLDLDLDLEADLGIDTVKQAEMFAAIRAAYNIPRDANLRLRDFPTLAHVIKFAHDRRPGAAAVSSRAQTNEEAKSASAASSATVPRVRPPLASFDAVSRIARRVPVPTLRPPLNLCKPTKVTLGRGQRVVIMPDTNGVAEALADQLRGKGVEVLTINRTLDSGALENCLKTWLAAGQVHGVYWLPALDIERNISEMDSAAWHEALRVRLKSLYVTMRALYQQIAPVGTFLISATRLGGQHGYDPAGAIAPLGGAVTGFTKTYKRERIDALVKAVDFETQRKPSDIAETLIAETLRDFGAVEVGYRSDQRWTVGVQEQPAADGRPGLTLDGNTVFLVTGAAGSIVSAITADLAAASGGIFFLLDLVPEPDPNNPDLKRFADDKEGLKRDLFARMQARGERATPALIEKELAALERAQAAQSAIDAVRAAGGTAHYFSVNLTDSDAVGKVIAQVRERCGRIDVLLHAAGMERSHLLPDKDPREFNLIFDVKADGWFNLLHAIADMPLGATVAFSSVAGRFGNPGQTDYSSANDLLCKMTSSFRTARPSTRAIAIDWTAWAGIGMATRGSIPKMMEIAGIDMLPPEAGVPLIRRELTAGGTRGELVIGQRLGIMLNEWDPEGGIDAAAVGASVKPAPMLGKIAAMALHRGLTVETTLDPKQQPFLHDHQIDGTPVLPGVMGIEAFAEAALSLLPGWHIAAIEDVNFVAPFKFYRGDPRTVTVESIFYADGDALLADCRLIGVRTLPNQPEPQVTTHFTARVRLSREAVKAGAGSAPEPGGSVIEAADIYRVYFHGPAYQVVQRAWRDGNRTIGLMASNLPGNHHPPESPLSAAPRLIELCFQTAGLWEMVELDRFGLPQHVDQLSVFRAPEDSRGPLYAVVTSHPDLGAFDAEVVDTDGNRYVQLKGYRTVALPAAATGEKLKALHAIA